ncbi:hypothetical protein [Flavitalea sp.]|nr:hypothetical protein [Flavitalea sp.]
MFNNVALDVFIGLVFVFLLYSLLATIIQEMIATRLALRAKVLEKAIIRMLEDIQTDNRRPFGDRIDGSLHLLGLKNLLKKGKIAPWFYAHPLIKYFGEDNYYSKPAYLDASNFSKVIIDLLKDFNLPESQTVQSIHNSIMNGIIHKLPINISNVKSDKLNPAIKVLRDQNASLPGPNVLATETVLLNANTALFIRSLWQDSGADLNVFRSKLENWFNDTMDRATGWYKKYTRMVLLIIGVIVAYVFNVDSIAIHRILSTNKVAREQLVQMAIANKDNLNPDKFKSSNDSILNVTYKMVAKDASDANDILGLGTSWKDSCKICKIKLGCQEKKTAAKIKLDSLIKVKTHLGALLLEADIIIKEKQFIDSLLMANHFADTSLPVKLRLNMLTIKSRVNDSLMKLYPTQGLSEIDPLNTLLTRCPLIQDSKVFQYSPNQKGGMETLLGWLITALAITLGAPFWFDLLSKVIKLRGTGPVATPGDDNTQKTKYTTTSPASAINVTVNPNPGEEAVG